ncbi:hypothetical protein [Streptomyces canus]|uniref:hypothetical protein n=1 Tax=Streptomyces canus TaxID=58343 RepID=UPI002DD8DBFF|nr:hypothetical protein [Streptomyces canus]WSD86675.1 hypothetical protein OG925_21270 [Streptomyces canus]
MLASADCQSRAPDGVLLEFDGVREAGEVPAFGAFADVGDDDVVDEVVLELVVGEFAGELEVRYRVQVAAGGADAPGAGPSDAGDRVHRRWS